MISAVDPAGFHHEADLLQDAYVGEGVAGNSNDICEIAWLESADLILPTEKFRAVEEIGLKSGERRHAIFNHEAKFAGLRAVREWTDIGAYSHGYASGELLAKFLGVEVLHAVFAFALRGRGGVIGEVFGDRERGDGEDFLSRIRRMVSSLSW